MVSLTNTNSVTSQLRDAFSALTANLILDVPALTLTRTLVGAVMEVRLNYPDFKANVNGISVSYTAGTITLNTADVLVPTNHHVVIPETTGVLTVITTDPDTTYGRNNYVYLALVRFQSIAGTELVFYLRRMYNPITNLLNEIGDYASDIPYTWVSGAGPTIDPADGSIDLEATNYRRWKFASTLGAQTDAPILLDDEATVVADLEDITTYNDGSAITAGKYHKIALLLICSGAADVRLVALRQAPPTVEYATLEEARIDAENRAATVAPTAYYAPTFPLAYVYMLVGDASDLGVIDLREPGFGGGGGGGGGVGDHSLLVNLAADDRLQYSRTDGTRAFTGDIDLGTNAITNVGDVDGVDISAHAADAEAHQDLVTLDANADTLLSLSTQELGLDTQTANYVFAGPASGVAAVPTFRVLTAEDMAAGPLLPFATFSDSTTQSIVNTAAAQAITFNTTDLLSSAGLTRTSTSRTTVNQAGTYEIIFSGIANLAALPANKYIEVWLRVDGVDVPRTNTRISITAANVEMTVAVALQYKFTAGQYFELWTWGDDTDCQWKATAAGAAPVRPATPSVILTVKMISGAGLA